MKICPSCGETVANDHGFKDCLRSVARAENTAAAKKIKEEDTPKNN